MADYPSEITLAPFPSPPRDARVRVPGSKSVTNRALIIAALAEGKSRLEGALDSEDTRVMAQSLRTLGIDVTHDPASATIDVTGSLGRIPVRQAELFVAN